MSSVNTKTCWMTVALAGFMVVGFSSCDPGQKARPDVSAASSRAVEDKTTAVETIKATETTATAATAQPTFSPPSTQTAEAQPTAKETMQQSEVYYKSCAEAKAAGVAPMRKGEPGYRPELDRDKDGVACDK